MYDAKPNDFALTHCHSLSEPPRGRLLSAYGGEDGNPEGEDWTGTGTAASERPGSEATFAARRVFEPTDLAVGQWMFHTFRERTDKAHSLRRRVQELSVLQAPHTLIQRSQSVLRDVTYQTRLLAALIEQYGGSVERAPGTTASVRGLLPLALENARLGCARETLSFSVRLIQAGRATDLRISRTMRRIAHDQIRQAQLSWDLHEWCLSELDREEARQVEEALAETFAQLAVFAGEPDLGRELRSFLGLPTEVEFCKLARRTMHTLARARGNAPASTPYARRDAQK